MPPYLFGNKPKGPFLGKFLAPPGKKRPLKKKFEKIRVEKKTKRVNAPLKKNQFGPPPKGPLVFCFLKKGMPPKIFFPENEMEILDNRVLLGPKRKKKTGRHS